MNLTGIIALSVVITAVQIKYGDDGVFQACTPHVPEKTGEVAANAILAAEKSPRISYQIKSGSTERLITERALARILFEDSKAEVTSLKPQARRVKNVAVAQQVASLRNGRQNRFNFR